MLFPSNRHKKLFMLLAGWTAFIAILIFIRVVYTNHQYDLPDNYAELKMTRGLTFAFLGWNLVLAWVPYLLALTATAMYRKGKPIWKVVIVGLVWLLFLPNAPYIVTDLLHLHYRPPVPMWFDVVLIFSAAWTGLMLCFISLREIHKLFELHFRPSWKVHTLMMGILALTGFGVWLGRFHRWNSWDLFTRPNALLTDIMRSLTQMPMLKHSWIISGILFIFLSLGYYTMLTITEKR